MKDLLAALEQQLKQLIVQAKAIDGKQSSWQQKAWFDSDLFPVPLAFFNRLCAGS